MAGTPITIIKEVEAGFIIHASLHRPTSSAIRFYLSDDTIPAMDTPIKASRQIAETDLLRGGEPVGFTCASIFSDSTIDLTHNPLYVNPGR